jgi:hypothetical protein
LGREPKPLESEVKESGSEDQKPCERVREATVSSNFLDESGLLKFVRNSDKVMTSEVVRR